MKKNIVALCIIALMGLSESAISKINESLDFRKDIINWDCWLNTCPLESFHLNKSRSCLIDFVYRVCEEKIKQDGFEVTYKHSVKVDTNKVCVEDSTGKIPNKKCVAKEFFSTHPAPDSLRKPKQIVSGALHMCSLSEEGVHCWGDPTHGATKVPKLDNPVSITSGDFHVCAQEQSGKIKCWGSEILSFHRYQKAQGPTENLVNPRFLTSSHGIGCVLSDEGIHCWGDNCTSRWWTRENRCREVMKNINRLKKLDGLDWSTVRSMSLSSFGLCVVGNISSCVSLTPQDLGRDTEAFANFEPKYIYSSVHSQQDAFTLNNSHCFVDEEGIKCFIRIDNYEVALLRKGQFEKDEFAYGFMHYCYRESKNKLLCGKFVKFGRFLRGFNPRKVPYSFHNILSVTVHETAGIYVARNWRMEEYPKELGQFCAIDGDGIKCWTYQDGNPVKTMFIENK